MQLSNLPTELLLELMSYLPTRDKVTMRYVSRRFRDVSEIPSLWKEFLWLEYEPRHVCSVSSVLKVSGEHVRRIFFPDHMTAIKILEMLCYCRKVTHLYLTEKCQLSLHHMMKIVHTMTRHLQQLDVFTDGTFVHDYAPGGIKWTMAPKERYEFTERLLKAISVSSVRKLNLHTYYYEAAIEIIQHEWVRKGYPIPNIVINIHLQYFQFERRAVVRLLRFLSSVTSLNLPSFEITLYNNKRIPMNLYPAVPIRKFQFSPSATPLYIRLSNHNIMGLKYDVFHLCRYDHRGTVRYAIIHEIKVHDLRIEEKHFGYSNHLHSVSYADISNSDACPDHLKQLAIVCPNLEQLNLQGNVNCLKDLEGLRAIVHTCQNLESLNFKGISVSSVESYLLLWELLSSLKNLTHLVIDLCVLQPPDCSDADKQSLASIFRSCWKLKALEISSDYIQRCMECNSSKDFLFSCFPSLTHCTMWDFQYSGIMYAINNCHGLKYLYEYVGRERNLPPLSNNCHLQELCIDSPFLNLTDEIVEILSAHGDLERVTLLVNSITIKGITTLVSSSPNLTFLLISIKQSVFGEVDASKFYNEHTSRIKKMLPYHKLFETGRVLICSGIDRPGSHIWSWERYIAL